MSLKHSSLLQITFRLSKSKDCGKAISFPNVYAVCFSVYHSLDKDNRLLSFTFRFSEPSKCCNAKAVNSIGELCVCVMYPYITQ